MSEYTVRVLKWHGISDKISLDRRFMLQAGVSQVISYQAWYCFLLYLRSRDQLRCVVTNREIDFFRSALVTSGLFGHFHHLHSEQLGFLTGSPSHYRDFDIKVSFGVAIHVI